MHKRPTVKEARELRGRIAGLEVALFEAETFGQIASDKLTVWVTKHDELLIKYKELTTTPRHGKVIRSTGSTGERA